MLLKIGVLCSAQVCHFCMMGDVLFAGSEPRSPAQCNPAGKEAFAERHPQSTLFQSCVQSLSEKRQRKGCSVQLAGMWKIAFVHRCSSAC